MIGMEQNFARQARAPKVARTTRVTLKVLEALLTKFDRDIDDAIRGSLA